MGTASADCLPTRDTDLVEPPPSSAAKLPGESQSGGAGGQQILAAKAADKQEQQREEEKGRRDQGPARALRSGAGRAPMAPPPQHDAQQPAEAGAGAAAQKPQRTTRGGGGGGGEAPARRTPPPTRAAAQQQQQQQPDAANSSTPARSTRSGSGDQQQQDNQQQQQQQQQARNRKSVVRHTGPLYAGEVVGRRCAILRCSRGSRASWWEKAKIVDWDAARQQHKLLYITDGRSEEWLSLGDVKFKWDGLAPAGATPNPTHRADIDREAAVGRRLRLYWPAMQRWYIGQVKEYDAKTDRHTIWYRDGDAQTLCLRHEPVLWIDGDAPPSAPATPSNAAAAAAGAGAGAAAAAKSPRATAGSAAARLAAASPPPATAAAAAAGKSSSMAADVALKQPVSSSAGGAASDCPTGDAMAALTQAFPPTPPETLRLLQQRAGLLGKHARDYRRDDRGYKRPRSGSHHAQPALSSAVPVKVTPIDHPCKASLVGCRVSVFWRMDKYFYRGKLTSFSPASGKFTIKYDDGQTEQLLIERERMQWHGPRGFTAGYSSDRHSAMAALGVEGVAPAPEPGGPPPTAPVAPPQQPGTPAAPITPLDMVGWRLRLWFAGDARWHDGEVLSYDVGRRLHHVLYLDGEHEWVELAKEVVAWVREPQPGGAVCAGAVKAEEIPIGRSAIGWRVAVYWRDDRTFYEGQVVDYDAASGCHRVLYADDEEELLLLRNERVIWRVAPRDDSDASDFDDASAFDDESDGDDGGGFDEETTSGGSLGPRGARGARGPRRRRARGRGGGGGGGESEYTNSDSEPLLGVMRRRAAAGGRCSSSGGYGGGGGALWPRRSVPAHLKRSAVEALEAAFLDANLGGVLGLDAAVAAGGNGFYHPLALGSSGNFSARVGGTGGAAGGGGAAAAATGCAGAGLSVLIPGAPSLPPLNTGRRASTGLGGGAASAALDLLLSPPRHTGLRARPDLRLLVRISAGAAPSSAAPAAPPAPAAAEVERVPPRHAPRAASRLQHGIDRLQLVMSKLATTATNMGWHLDPAEAAAAAAAQKRQRRGSFTGGGGGGGGGGGASGGLQAAGSGFGLPAPSPGALGAPSPLAWPEPSPQAQLHVQPPPAQQHPHMFTLTPTQQQPQQQVPSLEPSPLYATPQLPPLAVGGANGFGVGMGLPDFGPAPVQLHPLQAPQQHQHPLAHGVPGIPGRPLGLPLSPRAPGSSAVSGSAAASSTSTGGAGTTAGAALGGAPPRSSRPVSVAKTCAVRSRPGGLTPSGLARIKIGAGGRDGGCTGTPGSAPGSATSAGALLHSHSGTPQHPGLALGGDAALGLAHPHAAAAAQLGAAAAAAAVGGFDPMQGVIPGGPAAVQPLGAPPVLNLQPEAAHQLVAQLQASAAMRNAAAGAGPAAPLGIAPLHLPPSALAAAADPPVICIPGGAGGAGGTPGGVGAGLIGGGGSVSPSPVGGLGGVDPVDLMRDDDVVAGVGVEEFLQQQL